MAADRLPPELWGAIGAHLRERDVAALALCSTSMRIAAREAFAARKALRVRHSRAAEAAAACPDAQGLVVHGFPRRYSTVTGSAVLGVLGPLPGMPRLLSLELHHPRLPTAPGFWPAVFAGCPLLRRVKFIGDFFISNYGPDVEHVIELLTHGAPRLQDLDIEGGWLVLYRLHQSTVDMDPRLAHVVKTLAQMPPVQSTTLRRLRHACHQVPLGVDGPVEDLYVDEQYGGPPLVGRLGPRTLASVTRLTWRARWPACDAGALGAMAALRDADISLFDTSTPDKVHDALRGLASLPRGIRRLALHLDMWLMRTAASDVQWPEDALAHLDQLERLEVSMLFPPDTVDRLLGQWMGAGPSVRAVSLRFSQSATCALEQEIARLVEEAVSSDDEPMGELQRRRSRAACRVDGTGLAAWLDARPSAVATILGLPDLCCAHPRCCVSY